METIVVREIAHTAAQWIGNAVDATATTEMMTATAKIEADVIATEEVEETVIGMVVKTA